MLHTIVKASGNIPWIRWRNTFDLHIKISLKNIDRTRTVDVNGQTTPTMTDGRINGRGRQTSKGEQKARACLPPLVPSTACIYRILVKYIII